MNCSSCGYPVSDPFEHIEGCPRPKEKRAGVHYKINGLAACGADSLTSNLTIHPNEATCAECDAITSDMWARLTQ